MTRPIDILHVYGRMGLGGAEMWVINAMRRIDRERFRFHFLVHLERAGELDDELRAMGATIHVAPGYRNPARYPAELRRILGTVRPDIVHSHVGFYTGWVLSLARAMGIRHRMAHSHNDLPTAGDTPARVAYKRIMRAAIHANATAGLGCSAQACAALYGSHWRARGKYDVLLYGYDFGRFAGVDDDMRAASREALGLGPDDFVIGHIGRFVEQKNHDFIIELAAAGKARGRHAQRFVLVGDGPLRADIEGALARRGLTDRFVLAGLRSDIPEMLAAFDVFILPSRWEGLGIVALEAQAAGLPCILGNTVPEEAVVVARNVVRRPIDDVHAWQQALDEMQAHARTSREEALRIMMAGPFGIEQHVARLERIYAQRAST